MPDWDLERLRGLIGLPETDRLEFKLALNESGPEKLLNSLAAFANTKGGDLIIGIAEKNGLADAVVGIDSAKIDGAKRKLEDWIRERISPRLFPLLYSVDVGDGKSVIVVSVKRSTAGPHLTCDRFYRRTSSGVSAMSFEDVRTAFLGSENAAKRARAFRESRLRFIRNQDGEQSFGSARAFLAIHFVPLSGSARFSLEAAVAQLQLLKPTRESVGPRYNLDGLYCEALDRQNRVQFFRDGCVEEYDFELVVSGGPNPRHIGSRRIAQQIVVRVHRTLAFYKELGVEAPLAFMLSLVGVNDVGLATCDEWLFENSVFDRDELLFPDEVLVDFSAVDDLIHRILNLLWNAAGVPQHNVTPDELTAWRGAALPG